MKRIGFACKISALDPKKGIVPVPEHNLKATTVAWLKRQTKTVAEHKLWEITKHNLAAVRSAVNYVGGLDERLRLFRLGSDILPLYTEPNFRYFWAQPDVRRLAEQEFNQIGRLARDLNVRLSFHPGQFCCIVSDRPDVVDRSIEELEYHADMMRWMGFGQRKLDFKINIHLSGRQGPAGFEQAWHKMSPELRNALTLENDEYQQGLDDLLPLGRHVGIVLDIHHHLIKTGEYIQADDPRIAQVQLSWQGQIPVTHYSQSREEHIGQFEHVMPSMQQMLAESTRTKLRAHSDFYPNRAINAWALTHLSWSEIMAESKSKNLGSQQLLEQLDAGATQLQ